MATVAKIATVVGGWVSSGAAAVGVSSAVATAAGAVATAAVTGAVYGAAIGAASAAIQGGDIGEGALNGAIIGGVSAGVMKGFSIGMSSSAASSSGGATMSGSTGSRAGLEAAARQSGAGTAKVSGLSSGGGPPSGVIAGPKGTSVGTAQEAAGAGGTSGASQATDAVVESIGTETTKNAVATEPSFWDKILQAGGEEGTKSGLLEGGSGKIIGGVVQGTAEGLLSQPAEPESTADMLAAQQKFNKVGEFKDLTANIKVPDHWKKYNRASNDLRSDGFGPEKFRSTTNSQTKSRFSKRNQNRLRQPKENSTGFMAPRSS